jgi:hypothetical protein
MDQIICFDCSSQKLLISRKEYYPEVAKALPDVLALSCIAGHFGRALSSISSAQPFVPAQEILAKIAGKEPVYHDGARISGDLDLSTLPKAQVSDSFVLVNCTVPNASFAGVTFADDAVFWGTSFDNASFEKASFLGRADFSNASFGLSGFAGLVDFVRVEFAEDAAHYLCIINSEMN